MKSHPFFSTSLPAGKARKPPTIGALQTSYLVDRKAPITLAPCTFLDRPRASWEGKKEEKR